MPFGIQPWHIVAIFIVALIVFGPSKLPEFGRSVGKALNEFRIGARDMTDSFKEELYKNDPTSQTIAPPNTIQRPYSPPSYTQTGAVNDTNTSPVSGNFCTSCGSPNPLDANFCKNCGKPLNG